MDRDEFADLIERTKAERPTWFDLEPDTPPDAEQLRVVEEALGAQLPADYSWFLGEYGGGDFAFTRIHSADPRSDLYLGEKQGAELPDEVISFSENGAGDSYVFPVEGGAAKDRVLFYDHETGELSAEEDEGFLAFVARKALRRQ